MEERDDFFIDLRRFLVLDIINLKNEKVSGKTKN